MVSTLAIHFYNEVIYHIPTGKYGPSATPRDILLTGDSSFGLDYLQVLPEVQTIGWNDEITVTVACTDPPWFLPQRTPIAQAFFLPDSTDIIPENPTAFWAEIRDCGP